MRPRQRAVRVRGAHRLAQKQEPGRLFCAPRRQGELSDQSPVPFYSLRGITSVSLSCAVRLVSSTLGRYSPRGQAHFFAAAELFTLARALRAPQGFTRSAPITFDSQKTPPQQALSRRPKLEDAAPAHPARVQAREALPATSRRVRSGPEPRSERDGLLLPTTSDGARNSPQRQS